LEKQWHHKDLHWGNDKIEQGLLQDAEFMAAGVPKNVLFTHF